MVILRKKQQFDLMVCFLVMGFIFFLRSEHGVQLYPELHAFDLPVWSIGCQYVIGLIFIAVNVIPKYLHFGGAKRHLNDNLMEKKSYFTRNYVRLFMHIISGASLYVFIGIYFLFESYLAPIMPVTFWKFFIIFWDFIHQVTIILMTRNHDGIYLLRAGNVLLAFVKCLFDIEIFYCTTLDEIRPFALSVWFYTQGFAGTRLLSFLTAMVEMSTGYEFDALKENWYSIGLSWAQIYVFIMYPRAMLLYCACTFVCAPWFRHELWTKRDDYQYRAMAVSFIPFVLSLICIVVPYGTCPYIFTGNFGILNEVLSFLLDSKLLHTLYSLFLIWFNFHYLGMYYKRLPLKGVDFLTPKMKKGGAGIACPITGMVKRISARFAANARRVSGNFSAFKCPFSGMVKSKKHRVKVNVPKRKPVSLATTCSEPTTVGEKHKLEAFQLEPLCDSANSTDTEHCADAEEDSDWSTDGEGEVETPACDQKALYTPTPSSTWTPSYAETPDFHPDLLARTEEMKRHSVFEDFRNSIMDPKLKKGLALAISLEATLSLTTTESGRKTPRKKLTKASEARVASMHNRQSFY